MPKRKPIPVGLLAATRDGDMKQSVAARSAGVTKQTFSNRLLTFRAEQARQRSRRALQVCANWLAYCLSIGWSRSELDDLEQIWWRWHDENGNLLTSARVA